MTDDLAKASYSLGYQVADNVDQQFQGGLTSSAFVQGVQDRLASRESLVSAEDSERLRSLLNETREAALASQGLKNLEAGLAFLAENGAREGVVTTESGLQYEVLQTGDGPKPGPRDQVTTHYEGRLIDGTVFDSSYQRGEPATFPLDRVIPGWTEALQLMPQGSKWRLYVPADLAYGERAAGRIPPNSTLVFDVELLNVEPAAGQ
ncbi:MAG: FKBP-type peptidyl-prolyl cis-trans isomerase [Pseudomonadales bacterium]